MLLFGMDRPPIVVIMLGVITAGITGGGVQVIGTSIAGMLYPTKVRVTGVGWVIGMGRTGAIFGPLAGAAVFALALPPQQMFLFAAAPMVVGALAGLALAILCRRRFGSVHVAESVPLAGPAA